jgi:hypothetical protein
MSRSNWLFPLWVVIGALLLLANAYGVIPPTILDLIGRASPILLILFGLNMLIGRRIRFANFAILGLCTILTTGVIVAAYGKQSAVFREDYQVSVSQPVNPATRGIKLNITTLLAVTEIKVNPEAAARTITGAFTGSRESKVSTAYTLEGDTGLLTIAETRASTIPNLTSIGRGKLTVNIPQGVAIDELIIRAGEGNLTINLATLNNATIRTLTVQLESGKIQIDLPPLSPQTALAGTIRTANGDIQLTAATGTTLKFTIERGTPQYDPSGYLLLSGGVIQTAGVRDFQAVLGVSATGNITIRP